MPCGQKKSAREIIHSQTVTPPFAALDGTTLRLKTATTKSRTRSPRPSTRRRCGASCASSADGAAVASFANGVFSYWTERCRLVSGRAHKCRAAFLLGFCKRGRDFLENRKMLLNVRFRVLNGDGPLLIPPIRLCQHAAINHAEPVVAPEIDIDFGPVAVVQNFLGIKHQRAIDSGAGDIGLQAGFFDDGAIAFGQFLAEFVHMRIVFSREDFAERRQTG